MRDGNYHTTSSESPIAMELAFDLSTVFGEAPLVRLDTAMLRQLNPRRCWAVQKLINEMGQLSSEAQGLRRVLTSYEKLIDAEDEQTLYVLWRQNPSNPRASLVIGILKVGRKHLYLCDAKLRCFEANPICILDFYVFGNLQRQGHGHLLYDFMLQQEGIAADAVAIDKPSESLLSFYAKHYALTEPIWQNTNFVVYPGFFDHLEHEGHQQPNDHLIAGHQVLTATPRQANSSSRCAASRSTAAGIIHGTESLPMRMEAGPATPHGMKNKRDYGHQSLW